MSELVDPYGRRHDTLRVSVTDRCNLRCRYCMPEEGIDCQSRDELLSFEALVRVVSVGADLGIDAVRLTGGEPLVRRDIADLVEMLRTEVELRDLAMTTNGLLLDRKAEALADAGLDRVNVSLDSLDPETFREITRHGDIDRVWSGIEAARSAGLEPVKVNTLVLRDWNDGEVDKWLELTRHTDLTVRFMELMPIGEAADPALQDQYVDVDRLRRELVDSYDLEPDDAEVGNGPARYWSLPDGRGKIGFITPRSNPYCKTCSRLRLTSTGSIRPCLASERETPLPEAPVEAPREAIEAAFRRAVGEKPSGHRWNEFQETPSSMAAIGG